MLTSILRYINLNLYTPASLGNSYTKLSQFGRSDTVVDLHGMPLGQKFLIQSLWGFPCFSIRNEEKGFQFSKSSRCSCFTLWDSMSGIPKKPWNSADHQQIHEISQKIHRFLGVFCCCCKGPPFSRRHIMQWPKPGGAKKSREVVWLGSLCFVLVASKTSGGETHGVHDGVGWGRLVFGGDVRNGFEKMPDLRICIYFVCFFFPWEEFFVEGSDITRTVPVSVDHMDVFFFAVLVPCQVSFISQVESC